MATKYSSRDWSRRAQLSPRPSRLGSRMTYHVAAAVLCFAVVQIWLVVAAIDGGAPRGYGIAAVLALMALAIPYARTTERRWHRFGEQALPSPALTKRFRSDVRRLWLLALLVPTTWVGTALLIGTAAAAI